MTETNFVRSVALPVAYVLLVPAVIFIAAGQGRRPGLPKPTQVLLSSILPGAFFVAAASILLAPMLLFLVCATLLYNSSTPVKQNYVNSVKSPRYGTDIFGLISHVFPALSFPPTLSTGESLWAYTRTFYPSFESQDLSDAFENALRSVTGGLGSSLWTSDGTLWQLLGGYVYQVPSLLQGPFYDFFSAFNQSMSATSPEWMEKTLNVTAEKLSTCDINTFLRMPHLSPALIEENGRISEQIHALAPEVESYVRNGNFADTLSTKLSTLASSIVQYAKSLVQTMSISDILEYVRRAADHPEVRSRLHSVEGSAAKARDAYDALWKPDTFKRASDWFFQPPSSTDGALRLERSSLIFSVCSTVLQIVCTAVVVLAVTMLASRTKQTTCVGRVSHAAWTGALSALAVAVPVALTLLAGEYLGVLVCDADIVRIVFCGVPARAAAQAFIALAWWSRKERLLACLFAIAVEEATMWRLPALLALCFPSPNFGQWVANGRMIELVLVPVVFAVAVFVSLESRRLDKELVRGPLAEESVP